MSIAVDTNVLVRFLVRDNEPQYVAAERLIDEAVESNEPVLIVLCALLETEWVLRSRYKLDKPSIQRAFERLVDSKGVVFENEQVVVEALYMWAWKPSVDFADCLLNARAADLGRARFVTFDRRAASLPRGELLA